MRPGSDSEPVAKSRCQPSASSSCFLRVLCFGMLTVDFPHATDRRQSFFDTGIPHPTCIQCTLQIIGEVPVLTSLLSVRIRFRLAVLRRVGMILGLSLLIFFRLGRVEVNSTSQVSSQHNGQMEEKLDLPQRTSTRHIHKPWIDTFGMELMVAWQQTDILALDKIIRTDRTGKVA